jgi:hypothetical protein
VTDLLLRFRDRRWRGFNSYRDLGGLEVGDLVAFTERQVSVLAGWRGSFEWRTHMHDDGGAWRPRRSRGNARFAEISS